MKPNLPPTLPAEIPEPCQIQYRPEEDDVFQVGPAVGILAPCCDRDFTISFCPKEVETRSHVCTLHPMLLVALFARSRCRITTASAIWS